MNELAMRKSPSSSDGGTSYHFEFCNATREWFAGSWSEDWFARVFCDQELPVRLDLEVGKSCARGPIGNSLVAFTVEHYSQIVYMGLFSTQLHCTDRSKNPYYRQLVLGSDIQENNHRTAKCHPFQLQPKRASLSQILVNDTFLLLYVQTAASAKRSKYVLAISLPRMSRFTRTAPQMRGRLVDLVEYLARKV